MNPPPDPEEGGPPPSAGPPLPETADQRLLQATRAIADLQTAIDEHAIVAITDPRGKILSVNDRFCEISGYSRNELVGQDHRLINSGYHSREFIRDLWTTIAQGQVWHGEIRNRAKDGSHYWVKTTIVPFLDPLGKPRQYIAIRSDITALKRAQHDLQHHAEELSRSNLELEKFAYVASHDLQEPLRGIAGCLHLLQKRYQDQLDGRAHEFILHAASAAERMQTLIDDLLEYSRVQRRGRPFHAVDLNVTLREVLTSLTTAVAESGAQIHIATLPTLQADASQMAQLFQNLLANAIKFRSAPGPVIHVSARPSPTVPRHDLAPPALWEFQVADNGIGIQPEFLDRIFGMFQRLHTRREYPGNGIGLAICQRIVERHGGRIWVDSQPGHGSTFHFTLPACAVSSASTGNPPSLTHLNPPPAAPAVPRPPDPAAPNHARPPENG